LLNGLRPLLQKSRVLFEPENCGIGEEAGAHQIFVQDRLRVLLAVACDRRNLEHWRARLSEHRHGRAAQVVEMKVYDSGRFRRLLPLPSEISFP
jgi:hypothetical protein